MAVHPLCGVEVPVFREERDQFGRRYVVVVESNGAHRRLPAEWTSLVPARAAPRVGQRAVVLDPAGLVRLALLVRDLMVKEVDDDDRHRRLPAPSVGARDHGASTPTGPVDRSAFGGATGLYRQVGDVAQAPTAGAGHQGEGDNK